MNEILEKAPSNLVIDVLASIEMMAQDMDELYEELDGTPQNILAKWESVAMLVIYGDEVKAKPSMIYAYEKIYGCSPSSAVNAYRLSRNPVFRRILSNVLAGYRSELAIHTLMTKRGQAEELISRHELLKEIIRQRGEYYADDDEVPGGDTGLVIKQKTKQGTKIQTDTGLLQELNQIEIRLLDLAGETPYKRIDVTSNGETIKGPIIYIPDNGRSDTKALNG